MEMKGIGLLGNITEEEMKVAISAIENKRKISERKAKLVEAEKRLFDTIKEIESLGGSVGLSGCGYVPCGTRINSTDATQLRVSYGLYYF